MPRRSENLRAKPCSGRARIQQLIAYLTPLDGAEPPCSVRSSSSPLSSTSLNTSAVRAVGCTRTLRRGKEVWPPASPGIELRCQRGRGADRTSDQGSSAPPAAARGGGPHSR
eukprot:scaffold17683_cov69-Phaeocystis_antarctica.AAC.5